MPKTKKKTDQTHHSGQPAATPTKAKDNARELTDEELDKVAGGVGVGSLRGLDDRLAAGLAFVKRTRR
jgi:hypothetical protein